MLTAETPEYQFMASELRQQFDAMFAAPDRALPPEMDEFLAIRVGTRPFALRVSELLRIESGRKVVPLPGGDPWLLGLASSQGKLLPVHSLELALGLDRTRTEKTWISICGRTEPLGLAFDAVDGYVRVRRDEVFSVGNGDSAEHQDQQAISGDGELRPVVNISTIMAAIRSRVTGTGSHGSR